jgi:hypothetical protein
MYWRIVFCVVCLNFNFKLIVLKPKDITKMVPIEVDVDSIIYGFSSLAAYKPNAPFDVNVTGNCVQCQNIKLLQGLFGVFRKCKYERLIEVRLGLLICFNFIAYSHVEFTLGGDPAIRVLLSVPSVSRSSDPTSEDSDDEVDDEDVIGYDYLPRTFFQYSSGPSYPQVGLRL